MVSTADIAPIREKLLNGIALEVEPDHISCEDGLALIAVVGRGMVKAKGTAAKIFAALAEAGINIKMIDQGSSELNIVIGIDESDFECAMNAIYDQFRV